MNLLHIFESERPGSAQPYSKLDREERRLAAILFHLLQNPANLKRFYRRSDAAVPAGTSMKTSSASISSTVIRAIFGTA
jgi:hypothetical protein